MKKLVSIFLSLLLFVSILPFSRASAASTQTELQSMVAQGIISGFANGDLAPNELVNRGQFATFITRALKLPNGEHRFTDVSKNSSLALGINAAASAGIVSGFTATTFKPEQVITREQMAIMIDRALTYLKIEKKQGDVSFVDRNSIKAIDAVSNMVGHQIMAGSPTAEGLMFKPNEEATRGQAASYLYRMLAAYNQQGSSTKPPVNDNPSQSDDEDKPEAPSDTSNPKYPYSIGTVDKKGATKVSTKTYKTLQEANAALSNKDDQVILLNNKIIKMNSGIVVAKAPSANAATNVYESNLKTLKLGVMYGSEMEYVTSDENKVTVKVAGQVGYVKQTDAYLQPAVSVDNRSYYIVDAARNLKHVIYNPISKSTASYVYGKAPQALQQDTKYYSWDGATFTTEGGTPVGTFYQYFNMLPYRTTTNYSVAELESILMKKLEYVESLYKKNPTAYKRYKDATKKSKLIGLGQITKDFEKYYKINAFMVISTAIIESDYGMSANAQNKNNLFGIKVYDSNPSAGTSFKTTRDCVAELVNQYLNKNYVPVNGAYANSGILGNKSRGVNVRYATDPNWGQKIAGQMYMLDQEMGGKDFANNASLYSLYESTTKASVYASSKLGNSGILYTYPKEGYVFAVTAKEGNTSLRILSDSTADQYGYLDASTARLLPLAK